MNKKENALSLLAGMVLSLGLTCCVPQHADEVNMIVTTADRSFDLASQSLKFDESSETASAVIRLDTTTRYQTMDGFGAAITGSTAYNLSLMPDSVRRTFLEETFSPQKYGFSYVRVAIGCSDFSLSDYTCCDQKGIENFALTTEETKYVIPTLKEILSINPGLKILASPWTCPKWMKEEDLKTRKPYDSWISGQLNPDYYQDYATYFVKWIDAFKQAGVTINALTVQNEPLNRGNSASLFMGWEEQRDFVKTALGPALRKHFPDVKIYAFDHNYNYDNMADQEDYSLKIFADADAKQYFAGTAFHNYGGNRSELLDVQSKAPDMELVFTETSIGTWNQGRDLSLALTRDMAEVGLGTVNNGCKAVIVWNLVLDSERGPHGGPGACATCFGAVDVDNRTYSEITRNSHYYLLAHLASVVKPGATRIAASGVGKDGVSYSAFENTDGTLAFVLCNDKDETRRFTVTDGLRSFTYEMPAKSVVSFRWKK